MIDKKNQMLRLNPALKTLGGSALSELPSGTEVRSLFQLASHPKLNFLRKPRFADGSVYFPVIGQKDKSYYLHLMKIDLPNGSPELLGEATIDLTGREYRELLIDPVITDMCVTKEKIFVAAPSDLLVFDRTKRSTGKSIIAKMDLPSKAIRAFTVVGEKLYAGLVGGYLVEIDLAGETFKVLAQAGKENLSPFDDGEVFSTPCFFPDPGHNRILFVLYQRPISVAYGPFTAFPREPTNGLWEYNYLSKKFTKHIELFWNSVNSGSFMQDGRLLLGSMYSALAFDLKTNKTALLWAAFAPGPFLPRDSARNRESYFPSGTPRLYLNGWLWTSVPFGRWPWSKTSTKSMRTWPRHSSNRH